MDIQDNEILKYLKEVNAEEVSFQLFVVSASPSGSGSSSGGGISASTSGLFEDIKHFTLSDWAGTVAGTRNLKIEDVEPALQYFLNNIDYSLGADNWMQLCKTIVDSNNYPYIVNQYVIDSEKKLYDSPESTNLKQQYQANIIYQLFFNLVRFHAHASFKEYNISKKIIQDLYENWTDIDNQYQYPIIYYKFVESISSGNFQDATNAMKRFYMLIKMTDDSIKHASGMWDDWVAMLTICWFVCTNSPSFEKHFMNELKITDTSFHIKRKRSIVRNLNSNCLSDLLTIPYFILMKETYSISNIVE